MDDLARGGSDLVGGFGGTDRLSFSSEVGLGMRFQAFRVASDPGMRSFGTEMPLADFADYRDYLLEFYQWKRRENPRYSYRLLAAKLGMDHSYVHRLLHRKQHLSQASVARVCKVLGLDSVASDRFAGMVRSGRLRLDKEHAAVPGDVSSTVGEPDSAGPEWEPWSGRSQTRQVVVG